jgi:hypothetical protein
MRLKVTRQMLKDAAVLRRRGDTLQDIVDQLNIPLTPQHLARRLKQIAPNGVDVSRGARRKREVVKRRAALALAAGTPSLAVGNTPDNVQVKRFRVRGERGVKKTLRYVAVRTQSHQGWPEARKLKAVVANARRGALYKHGGRFVLATVSMRTVRRDVQAVRGSASAPGRWPSRSATMKPSPLVVTLGGAGCSVPGDFFLRKRYR